MTEKEWLACEHPAPMFEALYPAPTLLNLIRLLVRRRDQSLPRKLRLFACACCRRIWHLLSDDASRNRVEIAERVADGAGGEDELRSACAPFEFTDEFCTELESSPVAAAIYSVFRSPSAAAYLCMDAAAGATREAFGDRAAAVAEHARQAALLRDIFGNPFRPVAFDSAWRTSDVLALAKGIYDERAFDRMPILADALQDAGCTSDDILSHCRDTNTPHARGCWVVDLILGKS